MNTEIQDPKIPDPKIQDGEIRDGEIRDGEIRDGEIRDGEVGVTEIDDAARRLPMALGRLARVLRRGSPVGIGPGSLSALGTIVRCGPMRLGDLAAREGITPPTLSRIMAGLEEGGHVTRSPDPTDGRATRAQATPSAIDLINGTGLLRAGVLRARMAALSQQDLQALLRAVPVLEALAGDEA